MERSELEEIAAEVVDSAFEVHAELGAGLLESAYQDCLEYELRDRGIKVHSEVTLPVRYKEIEIDAGYRLDLLVENEIVVELKAVEEVLPVHEAQLLSYLKLS